MKKIKIIDKALFIFGSITCIVSLIAMVFGFARMLMIQANTGNAPIGPECIAISVFIIGFVMIKSSIDTDSSD